MNRLTAIGLASLVAYGVLIASKYAGVVSAARDDRAPHVTLSEPAVEVDPRTGALREEPEQQTLSMPQPIAPLEPSHLSAAALEFRASRDLKGFADTLGTRRASLTGDERYFLAKALEECQFATTINEDLAAYSAKKKREFLASLPPGEANNARRIAAYEAVDNTQRCIGFQNAKISAREIEELYRAAAMQGDPRAQARLLVNELGKNNNNRTTDPSLQNVRAAVGSSDDVTRIIQLLESKDPDAIVMVGDYLSRQSNQLRMGPNGEVPEPSALFGGFSLVACDLGQDCSSAHREPQQACAFAGYCNAQSYEELYQNFLASPWAYTQANRYRSMIHQAITTQNWSLIGLVPQSSSAAPQAR
jgi:hypothetical protein